MKNLLVPAVVPVAVGVHFLFNWLSRTDTRVGNALFDADHEAWCMAVEEKERELAELRGVEPQRRRI